MLFSRINLKTELIRERKIQQDLLDEVHKLLEESDRKDRDVIERLRNGNEDKINTPELYADEQDRIFGLNEIRNLCIRYRLRFLESKYFNSEYPYEAVAAIHAFEKKYSVKIKQFFIAAPEKTFDLENINKDPLLFAALDNGKYFLIHQWGKDLAWYKRITLWPLQNFRNCFISIWMLAALSTLLIPSSIMNIPTIEGEIYLRLWLCVHLFIAYTGFTIWAGLSFDKTVSSKNWNSKYYNY